MNHLDIKKIRKNLNLNQTDFGKLLGVKLRSVQSWESGERNISESAKILLLEKTKNAQSTHSEISLVEEKKEHYKKEDDISKNKIDSDLTNEEARSLAYQVAINEERLMQEKIFANIIETRVAKKIANLLSDEEEYIKWRKGN